MIQTLTHKFPSKFYLYCIPLVLVCFVFLFIDLKIFSNFPHDFFFDHWILGLHSLISTYFLIPQISVCYQVPSSFHCGQRISFVWLNKIIILWPSIWFFLECIPCALEKNVSCFSWLKFLYMSVQFSWFIVLVQPSLSLLVRLVDLSVLKMLHCQSAIITVELSIFPFISVNFGY